MVHKVNFLCHRQSHRQSGQKLHVASHLPTNKDHALHIHLSSLMQNMFSLLTTESPRSPLLFDDDQVQQSPKGHHSKAKSRHSPRKHAKSVWSLWKILLYLSDNLTSLILQNRNMISLEKSCKCQISCGRWQNFLLYIMLVSCDLIGQLNRRHFLLSHGFKLTWVESSSELLS